MGIDFYGAKTFMMDPRLSADLIPPERVGQPTSRVEGPLHVVEGY
jgi:hypothetical protein